MSNPNDYSIGVLIVLLLVFWHMCKHSGGACGASQLELKSAHECHYHHDRSEGISKQPKRNAFVKFQYGNTPTRIGSATGRKYIHSTASGNKAAPTDIVIPNSKTAMRRLFDEAPATYTNRQEGMSQAFADMHLNKQAFQANRNTPSSITSSRGMVHASQ